jgi:hypothetical protein
MPAGRPRAKKRRVIKGIEHGLSGYTNYGCRCDICTESNRAHHAEYRKKRYAGNPLCVRPRCPRVQSRAYGNGLCYRHAQELLELRERDPDKAARIAKRLGILQHVAA